MYHYLFNQLFLKLRLEKEKSELMNQVEKFASDLSKQEMLNVSSSFFILILKPGCYLTDSPPITGNDGGKG